MAIFTQILWKKIFQVTYRFPRTRLLRNRHTEASHSKHSYLNYQRVYQHDGLYPSKVQTMPSINKKSMLLEPMRKTGAHYILLIYRQRDDNVKSYLLTHYWKLWLQTSQCQPVRSTSLSTYCILNTCSDKKRQQSLPYGEPYGAQAVRN